MTGTLINVGTVIVGGTAGLLLGDRLPERVRVTVMQGLGLVTLLLGLRNALQTRNVLILLTAVALGGVLGELLRVQEGLDWIGRRFEAIMEVLPRRRAGGQGAGAAALPEGSFSRGFVTASLLFCIGPLTILGAFEDGLTGDYSTLAVKALLDGFAALVFASSLGAGVPAAALFVLVYQGALTLGARGLQPLLSEAMITELTAAGGILILGLGLTLLEIKPIRVASFLPALFLAPALVPLAGWLF
ncbi:MAG: DUF554 domain-containing protein [Chloroflexota bacterium]|nr:DUF554 domain-containing protein [Chloroflexota bacterium]